MNLDSFIKHIIIVLLPVQCVYFSCKSDKVANNVIKMNEAQIQTLYMSNYFESIEYIPLETKSECLIGNNPILYVTNEFIVTITSGNCFVFDRLSGLFLGKIGNRGRGPNEYSQTPQGIIVNEQEKTIFLGQGNRLIEYSLTDMSVNPQSIRVRPLLNDKLAYITKNIWVVALLNVAGNNPNQLLFFDREGMIDSIPNHYFFTPKTNEVWINPIENFFYRYDNDLYYKHLYNDTIFKIADKKLYPEWIFETKKSPQLLYQLRDNPSTLSKEMANYHLIYPILETDQYLFFNVTYQNQRHTYLFDKKIHQLKELENGGFINDIDAGLTFWPAFTNQNQDLVCAYHADILKEEISLKGLNEQNDKDILGFKKLRTLVAQLNEEDNPIVVIVKLKK